MSKSGNSPVEQLSQQLAMMEARERAKKRQLWTGVGLLVVVMVIAGVGFGSTFLTPSDSSYTRLNLDTLKSEHLSTLAISAESPLVLIREGSPIDTLTDAMALSDYLPALAHETVSTVPLDAATEATPPNSRVEVEGDKKVGTTLTYTIAPYDSAAQLFLDFGNGIVRPIQSSQMVYRYPLPGHFEMHLLWEHADSDSATILQTLKYQIFPAAVADA